MKRFYILMVWVFASLGIHSQTVVINEFLASNNADITDNYGEFEDWIEIYNPSSTPYNVGGLFFTDDLSVPQKYQLPVGNDSTIIPAGGYLVLFADNDPQQGVRHLDFKLSTGGEQIGIFDGLGNPIDTLTYPPQNTDVSYGRSPDGSSNWVFFAQTTPGASNLVNYLTPSVVLYNFPHTAGANLVVSIVSNVSWTVTNPVSWLSVSPMSGSNNGQITISVTEANLNNTSRTGIVTLSGALVNDQQITFVQFGLPEFPNIVINEIIADNTMTAADNHGEFEDWIEIYNQGSSPVNVGNLYITDNLSDPTKYQIPNTYPDSTTIAPGGFLLLWADNDPEQGVLHLEFGLNNAGEQVGIFYSQFSPIDTFSYGQQQPDTSYGRAWDGASAWMLFSVPTPGSTNALSISEVAKHPIKCYPNPCSDRLWFDSGNPGKSEVWLFSAEGKAEIHEPVYGEKNSLDISSLPSGLYFLKLITDDGVFFQKIMKYK